MVYSAPMHLRPFSSLLILPILLCSCAPWFGQKGATEAVDSFYTAQSITNELPDANLFIDERTEQKALALLERREARIGSFMERKRIGINRRVMLDGQGRSVIVVCIFEVRCSQGHSIEIVTVTQKNRTEGFFISDFTIEGMEAPMPSQKTRTSSA